ncbi:MAG: site-specific DNA-methyltransferase [Armatimonadia bacterium]
MVSPPVVLGGDGRPTATLYCGDCLEILPTLGKVDAVVTDPPYEIHAGAGGGCFGGRAHLVSTGGFTDSGRDYSFLAGQTDWVCFCSRLQLRSLLEIAEKGERFNLLTWCKPNPVPTCNNKYLPDVEYAVHSFSRGRLFGDMRQKSCFIVHPCGNKETNHPNEKPIPVMTKLVRLCSEEGDTIMDPYMGSGSTGLACINSGRNFVGIEIVPEHFEAAVKRIKAALAQPSLFGRAGSP